LSHSILPEGAFRALPLSEPPARHASGTLTGLASVFLHALTLGAVLVVPLLTDDRLPAQAGQVEAFFASPIELAPPPPPPPPPSVVPAVTRAPQPVRTGGFVAPVEVPTEIVPEAGLDLGIEGGLAGGVEGGVPGGVVGGIVGGLPDAPPPPPPAGPVRVGLDVREPRKVKHVPPVYPAIAAESRLEGVVVLECVIDPRGRVVDVKVERGLPLLDEAATDAVRQWVYTPTLINGVPTSVIMTVKVTFRLSPPA
jgi:protein TonB